MTNKQLVAQIEKKKSFLCVGLDTDLKKIPAYLLKYDDPVFEFNKTIIDATHDLVISYKPNIAFYEALGTDGWKSLEKTISYINQNHPEIFTIADAKRGDIGNTSSLYAKAFFEVLDFDAVTIAPYMGSDSVEPFLSYPGKWAILLALTSNEGANDFQFILNKENNTSLFKEVLKTSVKWGNPNNLMYVTGATRGQAIKEVREIVPESFLLVPGVGSQGGSLKEVMSYGLNESYGLIVNSSRKIIYAGNDENFASAARDEAIKVQQEMAAAINQKMETAQTTR